MHGGKLDLLIDGKLNYYSCTDFKKSSNKDETDGLATAR